MPFWDSVSAQISVGEGDVSRYDALYGKPVDVAAIRARSGWEGVSAVRDGEIHPLDGADILSPGPAVLGGLRQIHEIVQAFQAKSGEA